MSSNGNSKYLFLLTFVAALGGLLFGFDIAIITGAAPFIQVHFGLDEFDLGWAVSSLLWGCIIGAAIAGRITDLYGRKKILLTVAILFLLTSIGTGIAPDINIFILARFLGGFAVGAASILSPMYISEIAPAGSRGRLVAIYQLSIVIGILISYFINYILHDIGDSNWRWMFISGAIPSLVFFILLFLVPETPRYLFKKGYKERSYQILAKINAALFSTFVIGFVNLIFTLISLWAIDKYGRRPLYIIGSGGMALMLLGMTIANAAGRFEGSLVLILILAFIAFFASCIGPVFWTLVSEIFPNNIRGTAMSVPVFTQWIANALVVMFFPWMLINAGGSITFGFLTLMAILMLLFTIYFVPETKGKSLEEIEKIWELKK